MEHQIVQVLPFVMGVLAAGGSIAYIVWKGRRVDAAWKAVAAQLGLEHRERSVWKLQGGNEIVGTVGGHSFVIDTVKRGGGKNSQIFTRFKLDGRGSFDPGLQLKPESAWEGFKKVFAGQDIQLDDPTFDAAVNVHGPEDATLAALDERARMAVLKLVAQQGQVKDGSIAIEVRGLMDEPAKMVGLAQLMVAAADSLRVSSTAEALQRNAATDRNAGVRLRNLQVLCRGQLLDRPEAKAALEAALGDPSVDVRLFAAGVVRTGPRVREVLERLFDEARALTDAQRAQVLHLLEGFPYRTIADRVAQALDMPSVSLRVAAVRAAGRALDAAPLLARPGLARTTEVELGLAVAEALGRCGGGAAEPMLLDLLKADDVAVKAAAAKALGAVGTVRSVEPLLPFTQGLFADGALKDAARAAVRGIQSRLGEAQSGGLSVVDERVGEGALSLEENEAKERS